MKPGAVARELAGCFPRLSLLRGSWSCDRDAPGRTLTLRPGNTQRPALTGWARPAKSTLTRSRSSARSRMGARCWSTMRHVAARARPAVVQRRGSLARGSVPRRGRFASEEGERYGYRLTTGRLGDDGIRVRLGLDPTDRPLTIEADGMLRFEQGIPSFEGGSPLARPLSVASNKALSTEPWRAVRQASTASAASAVFDQIDLQYGPEDRAIKLTGAAELKAWRQGAARCGRQRAPGRSRSRVRASRCDQTPPVAVLRRLALFGGSFACADHPDPSRIRHRRGDACRRACAGGARHRRRRCAATYRGLGSLRPWLSTNVRLSGRLDATADGTTFHGTSHCRRPAICARWFARFPRSSR